LVAQVVHHLADAHLRGAADPLRVVEDEGDGRDGDLRAGGDVAQVGPAAPAPRGTAERAGGGRPPGRAGVVGGLVCECGGRTVVHLGSFVYSWEAFAAPKVCRTRRIVPYRVR